MNKTILCLCSHKDYKFPKDEIYKPIIVGVGLNNKELLKKYEGDNTKINISDKNPFFCELTSIYYVYKNYDFDTLGLVHYRRLFLKNNFCFKKMDNVITQKEIEKLLSKYEIILPKKRHYYIESNYSHYIHAHEKKPLEEVRKIIESDYKDYLPYFDKHMKKTSGHYFNMFIANKEVATNYLNFMFDILFKLEQRIDISNYSDNEKRVFGFISELLIDVYVNKNNLKSKDLRYVFFDKQNWFKKIFNFIKRKFSR